MFIEQKRRRGARKDVLYHVIMEDIFTIFGYGEDSKEVKMFQNLINNKPINEGLEPLTTPAKE